MIGIALLLLRLFLALLLAGHASQKLFGRFRGRGIRGTAVLFEADGLRPGAVMVLAAGLTEITAAALLVLGLATPLAATMTMGAMVVAAGTLVHKGLWAHLGGYEVPLAYGSIAFVLAVAGPGDLSLDGALGIILSGVPVALIGLAVAVLLSSPLLVMIRRHRRSARTG